MELHHWLDSGKPLMLLDVMNEDCFRRGHINGASRACVYETSFVEQVKKLNADTGASVAVYGRSSSSLAAQVAAEKLCAAGYTHVYALDGGTESWEAAGYPLEVEQHEAAPDVPVQGTFALDTEKSVVRWTGKNLLNHHEGTIRFSGGEIAVKNGELVSARFEADMRSIACADLADAGMNAMLIRHLMDADFFDTANWPTATFTADQATPISGTTPGSPNYAITGSVTLRGQTHPVEFTAVTGFADQDTIGGQAELDLDRTRWGALYGSGKFFDWLGGHLVNDLVHLHLKIVAKKRV